MGLFILRKIPWKPTETCIILKANIREATIDIYENWQIAEKSKS